MTTAATGRPRLVVDEAAWRAEQQRRSRRIIRIALLEAPVLVLAVGAYLVTGLVWLLVGLLLLATSVTAVAILRAVTGGDQVSVATPSGSVVMPRHLAAGAAAQGLLVAAGSRFRLPPSDPSGDALTAWAEGHRTTR